MMKHLSRELVLQASIKASLSNALAEQDKVPFRANQRAIQIDKVPKECTSTDCSPTCSAEPDAKTSRFQEIVTWRERIHNAAIELFLAKESTSLWLYFGFDAYKVARNWEGRTLVWVCLHLLPRDGLPLVPPRLYRLFNKYIDRLRKLNLRLKSLRDSNFAALTAKYHHLVTQESVDVAGVNMKQPRPWTAELEMLDFSLRSLSSLSESDRDSLIYHILRQRPDWVVGPSLMSSAL